MKKIVVALGGNALEDSNSPTAENQLNVIKKAVPYLVELVKKDFKLVITHGNGPQVGRILLQNEAGKDITPANPLDVCGAMSQGFIGYQIQQAMQFELKKNKIYKDVASIVTQVLVDKKDPAFENLSKPVGPFYTKEQADEIMKKTGFIFKEDSGRGYRRVVASPMPQEIIELDTIRDLVDNGTIVICCGGGGVPVTREDNGELKGIEAVIDKDFASAVLAETLGADTLAVLTAVPQVALYYGKPNQQLVNQMSINEANNYINEGHFAPGSMLPKVKAAISFTKSDVTRSSLITSLDKLKEALDGKSGTYITN